MPVTPDDMATALTVREVAERLGVSEHTVRRLIDAGSLESVRPSPMRLRVTLRALSDYTASLAPARRRPARNGR